MTPVLPSLCGSVATRRCWALTIVWAAPLSVLAAVFYNLLVVPIAGSALLAIQAGFYVYTHVFGLGDEAQTASANALPAPGAEKTPFLACLLMTLGPFITMLLVLVLAVLLVPLLFLLAALLPTVWTLGVLLRVYIWAPPVWEFLQSVSVQYITATTWDDDLEAAQNRARRLFCCLSPECNGADRAELANLVGQLFLLHWILLFPHLVIQGTSAHPPARPHTHVRTENGIWVPSRVYQLRPLPAIYNTDHGKWAGFALAYFLLMLLGFLFFLEVRCHLRERTFSHTARQSPFALFPPSR
jgi:hypothetical protein